MRGRGRLRIPKGNGRNGHPFPCHTKIVSQMSEDVVLDARRPLDDGPPTAVGSGRRSQSASVDHRLPAAYAKPVSTAQCPGCAKCRLSVGCCDDNGTGFFLSRRRQCGTHMHRLGAGCGAISAAAAAEEIRGRCAEPSNGRTFHGLAAKGQMV